MPAPRQFSLHHVFIVVTLFAVALGVLVKPAGRNLVLCLFVYLYALGPLLAVSFANPLGAPGSRRRSVLWFLVALFAAGMATVSFMFPEERLLAIGSLAFGTTVVWTAQYAFWRGLKWIVEYCFPSLKPRKDSVRH